MWGSNSRPSDICYRLWDWRAAYCANEALTDCVIEPTTLKGTTTTCKKVCLLVEHILKYFTGNRDQNSVVQHGLYPRIKAYIIRVHPWGWYRRISMRVEFYGCREGEMNDKFFSWEQLQNNYKTKIYPSRNLAKSPNFFICWTKN